jgi:hypothetical protein
MPPLTLTYAAVTTVEEANQYVDKKNSWVWVWSDDEKRWVRAVKPITSEWPKDHFAIIATYAKVLAKVETPNIKDPVTPPNVSPTVGMDAMSVHLKEVVKKGARVPVNPGDDQGPPM